MVKTSNAGVESWLWLFLAVSLSLSDPDPISELGIRRVVVVPTNHKKQRNEWRLGAAPLSLKGKKCSFMQ